MLLPLLVLLRCWLLSHPVKRKSLSMWTWHHHGSGYN